MRKEEERIQPAPETNFLTGTLINAPTTKPTSSPAMVMIVESAEETTINDLRVNADSIASSIIGLREKFNCISVRVLRRGFGGDRLENALA
mmetsp:Transcript_28028/g.48406  ORF Transcript_28028/g.48406 Transcript_28028/m.48406 type:complete len:91 (-) Transcript_28028:209-481(-)